MPRRSPRLSVTKSDTENDLELKAGCIVWGKYHNHAWWPVQLIKDFGVEKSNTAEVVFLGGDERLGEIRGRRKFEDFEKGYLKHWKARSSKVSKSYWTPCLQQEFVEALEEARTKYTEWNKMSTADLDLKLTERASEQEMSELSVSLKPSEIGNVDTMERKVVRRTPPTLSARKKQRRRGSRSASQDDGDSSVTPTHLNFESCGENQEQHDDEDVSQVVEMPLWAAYTPSVLNARKSLPAETSEGEPTAPVISQSLCWHIERLLFSAQEEQVVVRDALRAIRLMNAAVKRDHTMLPWSLTDTLMVDYFTGDYETETLENSTGEQLTESYSGLLPGMEEAEVEEEARSVFSPAFLAANDDVRNELFQVLRLNQDQFRPVYPSKIWKPRSWEVLEQSIRVVLDSIQKLHMVYVLQRSLDEVKIQNTVGLVELRVKALEMLTRELEHDSSSQRNGSTLVSQLFLNACVSRNSDGTTSVVSSLARIIEYGVLLIKNLNAIATQQRTTKVSATLVLNTLHTTTTHIARFLKAVWIDLQEHLPSEIIGKLKAVVESSPSSRVPPAIAKALKLPSNLEMADVSTAKRALAPFMTSLEKLVASLRKKAESITLSQQVQGDTNVTGLLAAVYVTMADYWKKSITEVKWTEAPEKPKAKSCTSFAPSPSEPEGNDLHESGETKDAPSTPRGNAVKLGGPSAPVSATSNLRRKEAAVAKVVDTSSKRSSTNEVFAIIKENTNFDAKESKQICENTSLVEVSTEGVPVRPSPAGRGRIANRPKPSAKRRVLTDIQNSIEVQTTQISKSHTVIDVLDDNDDEVETAVAPGLSSGGSPEKRASPTPFSSNRPTKVLKNDSLRSPISSIRPVTVSKKESLRSPSSQSRQANMTKKESLWSPSSQSRQAKMTKTDSLKSIPPLSNSPLKSGQRKPCYLIPISGNQKLQPAYRLQFKPARKKVQPIFLIGRRNSCDLHLLSDDETQLIGVSRRHAQIEVKYGRDGVHAHYVRDLFTINGTFVNWVRIPKGSAKILQPGDTITFGGGYSKKENVLGTKFKSDFIFQYRTGLPLK